MEIKRTLVYPSGGSLEICQGDITRSSADAIVNAANSSLNHGGGVALAIASKGGKVITRESRAWVKKHGPVTHEAPALTNSGNLPCKYVIHAVGPVWGEGNEEKKLASAIQGSIKLANKMRLESIAFPAISTGIYGFPIDRASKIFMREINGFLSHPNSTVPKNIKIILFDDKATNTFLEAFDLFLEENKKR